MPLEYWLSDGYTEQMRAGAMRKKNPFPVKEIMSSMGVAVIMLYLVFHALNGNHGVYALFKELRREETDQAELTALREQRIKNEHRVAMLSTETLDLDLLDEQARRVLGYTDPHEVIYLLPKSH